MQVLALKSPLLADLFLATKVSSVEPVPHDMVRNSVSKVSEDFLAFATGTCMSKLLQAKSWCV